MEALIRRLPLIPGVWLAFFFHIFSVTAQTGSQTIPNGASTAPITFPTGCNYSWTNNTPGIGLPASGTGNIASFTAINTGSTPITATINGMPTGNLYVPCAVNNYGGSGGLVYVVNAVTNTITTTIAVGGSPIAIAISPDATRAYAINKGYYSVINTATNTVIATVPMTTQEAFDAVVSADGSKLYVANPFDNLIQVFSTSTNTVIANITVTGQPEQLALNASGSLLYVPATINNTITAINTSNNSIAATYTVPVSAATYVSVSSDGSRLYAVCNDGVVRVLSTANGALLASISLGVGKGSVFSPDGTRLYVLDANGVSVINTSTNTVVTAVTGIPAPYGISISTDGSNVYAASFVGNVYTISTASNTITATIPVPKVLYAYGNFYAHATCTGTATYTITVNPSPQITTGAVTGTITACAGTASASPSLQQFTVAGSYMTASITVTAPTGFEVSLTPGSGYNTTLTLPQTAGTVSSRIIYIRSSATAAAGPASGNITLASTGGVTQNIPVSATINTLVTPSVTIATPNNVVCAGTPVTFTATPSNEGASPAYQWLLNGNPVGFGAATLTAFNLTNNQVISCRLTTSAACPTTPATVSNNIIISIIPLVTPSIAIATVNNTVCAGTPVTFTATPTSEGASPAYQWLLNGNPVGSGNTTFTTNTLANGDVINCTLTSNAACATTPTTGSNNVTMSIIPLVTPSISIATGNNTVCAGTPVTFMATPTGEGTSPAYQWLLNGNPAGTGTTAFMTNTLANNDIISCTLTSNATCATAPTAGSNAVTMNIIPQVTPAITISTASNSICAGTGVSFSAEAFNGGTAPAYQWLLNDNPVGSGAAGFTTNTLANNDIISCILTSNAVCSTIPATGSNTLTMTVIPIVTPAVTLTPPTVNICAGKPVTLTANLTDGGNSPTYQWLLNGNPTGTNNAALTLDKPHNGDDIYCTVTGSLACSLPVISSDVVMTVNPLPVISFMPDSVFLTSSSGVQLTPAITGNINTYQWSPGDGLNKTNIADPLAAPRQDMTYQLLVTTNNGCTTTGEVTVLISQALVMPTGFTPNGDGRNDLFRIPPHIRFALQSFIIFDRWGNTVFATEDISSGWDGNFKGTAAPTGTYIYIIKGKTFTGNPISLSGTISLIR